MTTRSALRIGTRGSPLARAQVRIVISALAEASGEARAADSFETVIIRTTGDRVVDRPLADIGGKGLFTKEIDEALLAGEIDAAVHSAKDLPTRLPGGIVMGAVLPREDPRDALIANGVSSIAALPAGAVVGTSSLRRQAQILHRRPDLQVQPLRGNVGTRIRKVQDGAFGATLLAVAGLRRLGETKAASAALSVDEMLPAVGQGAIAILCRDDDSRTRHQLDAIEDAHTRACIDCERAMLDALDGSCHTPIGGLAEVDEGAIALRALVASVDGKVCHTARRRGSIDDNEKMGRECGEDLRSRVGDDWHR